MVSIGRVGGISEGNYSTWTKKWVNAPANGLASVGTMDVLIDDKKGILSILYEDGNNKYRLGIYNISDFSAVYESPAGTHYTYNYPALSTKRALYMGMTSFEYYGFSRSIQTYLLLMRNNQDTIEVWQGGTSALWSTNTQTDFGVSSTCDAGAISITGKYILVGMYQNVSPYLQTFMLYEGV